jgi:hypothetical protein
MSELKDTLVNPQGDQRKCPFAASDVLQRTDASALEDPIYIVGGPTWKDVAQPDGKIIKECTVLPATQITVAGIKTVIRKNTPISLLSSTDILTAIKMKTVIPNILPDVKKDVYQKVGTFNLKTYIQHYMEQKSAAASGAATAEEKQEVEASTVKP